MRSLPYNETNPLSIEKYSKNLIGKTFLQILMSSRDYTEKHAIYIKKYGNKNKKGGLGQLIEECFFYYDCNNESRPDFDKAGVELKVTPYKINKNGSVSAKERLSITMIDYNSVIYENFYESHLWNKSRLMLLVFYLYNKQIDDKLDYQINYSQLFSPPEEDLGIIREDYQTIVNKIRDGKAHELSEADTFYLAAATKSSNSSKTTTQPFSSILAKPRAFSFKPSYMTRILNSYILSNKKTYEHIIKDPKLLKHISFKDYIVSRINSYIGKSDEELSYLFNCEYNNNKAQWSKLAYRMLGIRSNEAEEFVKANIKVKTIRIEEDGFIKQNMSLPQFKFKELIKQNWENSDLYNYFNEMKFLFVVYKRQGDRYVLRGCQLWNMPYDDLNSIVRGEWLEIQRTLRDGVILERKGSKVLNNFPKKSASKIIHIRPHSIKKAYLCADGYVQGDIYSHANELPDGQWMTTQSFWLNNTYVFSQLKGSLR